MAKAPALSPVIVKEVKQFMESSQPRRLGRNLRGLLLNMLQAQSDGYSFDLEDLLYDITFLFELLDVIEDEKN